MKIAVCLNLIQSCDGTSHFAMKLGEMLANSGHDVSMMAIHRTKEMEQYNQLPFINIRQTLWESKTGNAKRIARILKSNNFQIVFVCLGLPAGNINQAQYFMSDDITLIPVIGTDMSFVYQQLADAEACWNVGIAESPRLLNSIQSLLPNKKIFLLTTGIDQPTSEKLLYRAPFFGNIRLLYSGRLAEEKNVMMLPEILAGCKAKGLNVTITICGKGGLKKPLLQAFEKANLMEWVDFTYMPGQADLYHLYRTHHILLFPSGHCEGLGLVLLEAQANGCVPVSSNLPGVTDFTLENEVTGLLAELNNVSSFVDQIERLSDKKLWEKFSEAGLKRTQNRFSFDAMAIDYGDVIKQVVKGAFPLEGTRSSIVKPRRGLKDYLPGIVFVLVANFRGLVKSNLKAS